MATQLMTDPGEVNAVELDEVAGGAACATGKHLADAKLSSGSSSAPPNAWQEWMRTYFGVVPQ